jgi:hypothetical protein
MSDNAKFLCIATPISLIGALLIIAAMFADNITW